MFLAVYSAHPRDASACVTLFSFVVLGSDEPTCRTNVLSILKPQIQTLNLCTPPSPWLLLLPAKLPHNFCFSWFSISPYLALLTRAVVGGQTRGGTTSTGPAGSLEGQGTDSVQGCSDELFSHCGVPQRDIIAYVEMIARHCISSYGFYTFLWCFFSCIDTINSFTSYSFCENAAGAPVSSLRSLHSSQ